MDEEIKQGFEDEQEPDIIEMTDEDGNTILMEVLDYFFYNGEEYVILSDTVDEGEETDVPDEIDCYIMKVITSTDENGEELESFEPIEDLDLENKLIEIASNRMNSDDEADEE